MELLLQKQVILIVFFAIFLRKYCGYEKSSYFCNGIYSTGGLNPEKRGYMPLCPKCRGCDAMRCAK